jgi:uncharacterized protein
VAIDYHIFRDPVHGYIEVNDLERAIIDTAPFQRLRRIHQLAFTHYIYHGAEHTRFGHSIGTMEVATQIFDVLVRKGFLGGDQAELERNKQLLRLAALTHDLGHAPFSHAAEDLFPENAARHRMTHEDMSALIIQQPEISGLIRDHTAANHNINPGEVAALIMGEPLPESVFLQEILSGDLDADRIDYLTRDSMMTGVRYGVFDFERLIHSLTLRENGNEGARSLAVEEGGIHALEGLILARYFMFTQVYYHRARRSYDLLLAQFLRETLPGRVYPSSPEEFVQWDDSRVTEELRQANNDKDDPRNEVASRIFSRRHYRLVDQTSESAEPEEIRRWDNDILAAVQTRFGEGSYISDDPVKSPHKFKESDLRIRSRGDGRFHSVRRMSKLAERMPDISQRRLYATQDDSVVQIREFIRTFVAENPI